MKRMDWSSAKIHALRSATIVAAVVNFFADFLSPIAPFGLYIAAFFLALFFLAVLAYAVIPKSNHPSLGGMWFFPLAISMLIFVVFSYGSYSVSVTFGSKVGGETNGVLAKLVPGVEEIQKKLGVLDDINQNLQDISAKVGESNVILKDVAISSKSTAVSSESVSENTKEMAKIMNENRNPMIMFMKAMQNQDEAQMVSLIDSGEITRNNLISSGFYLNILKQQILSNSPEANAITSILFSRDILNVNHVLTGNMGAFGMIFDGEAREIALILHDKEIRNSADLESEKACHEDKITNRQADIERLKKDEKFAPQLINPQRTLIKMRQMEKRDILDAIKKGSGIKLAIWGSVEGAQERVSEIEIELKDMQSELSDYESRLSETVSKIEILTNLNNEDWNESADAEAITACNARKNAKYKELQAAFKLKDYSIPLLMYLKMNHREDIAESQRSSIDWSAQTFMYQLKNSNSPTLIRVSEIDPGLWDAL